MPDPITKITITAYDKNHERLLLDTTTATNADGDLHPNTYGKILDVYAHRTTANVPNDETGAWTQKTRRIAYFRTSERGHLREIYITKYGRRAGVRNYQTRRPHDAPSVRIEGAEPIHTAPRIERHPFFDQLVIVVGEGDPYRIDRSADTGLIIAEATRHTRRDHGWSGYTIREIYGPDRVLPDATVSTARAALHEAAVRYLNI